MFSLTVGEAAEELGVSASRVYQLIRSGALEAERIGRTWLVDDASVSARVASATRPGRPRRQRSEPRRYTLMNRTHEVVEFGYDEHRHRFCELGTLVDPSRAPLTDAGASLWQDVPIERLRRGDYRFLTKSFFREPNRQLRLVDDLSWLDIDSLRDFPEEVEAIISESEDLAPRASFIAEGVRQRIAHLRALF